MSFALWLKMRLQIDLFFYEDAKGYFSLQQQKEVWACCMFNKVLWGRLKWEDSFSDAFEVLPKSQTQLIIFIYNQLSCSWGSNTLWFKSFKGDVRFPKIKIKVPTFYETYLIYVLKCVHLSTPQNKPLHGQFGLLEKLVATKCLQWQSKQVIYTEHLF